MRNSFLFLALISVSASFGQLINGSVPDEKDNGAQLIPIRVALVEPGKPVVWHHVPKQSNQTQAREAVTWQTAYDSMQWTLTSTSSTDGTNFYGASPTPSLPGRLTTSVNGTTRYVDYSYVADDIQLRSTVNDGTWAVHRFRTRFFYNPGGALPPSSGQSFSGNVTLFIGLASQSEMVDNNAGIPRNPFSNLLGLPQTIPQANRGILIDFGTQLGGNKFVDLEPGRQLGVNIPLPATSTSNGAVILAVGQSINGAFTPLSNSGASAANAQFRVYDNCSPTDPIYPGTNPSDTTNPHWIDDRTLTTVPDYIYGSNFALETLNAGQLAGVTTPVTELRSAIIPAGTGGGLDNRRLNVGIGLAVNSSAKKLDLTLNRPELSTSSSGVNYDVSRFVPCNSAGVVEKDGSGNLRGGPVALHGVVATGNPTTTADVVRDPMFYNGSNAYAPFYRVIVKPYRGLSAISSVWDVSADGSASITFHMGDADGDDEVSITDYLATSRDYGLTSSDPGWTTPVDGVAPVDSDFDDDGEISIIDFIIQSTNYDQLGILRTI